MEALAVILSRPHASPGPHAFDLPAPDGFSLAGAYRFGEGGFEIEVFGPAALGGALYSQTVARALPRGARRFSDIFGRFVLYPEGEYRLAFDPGSVGELLP